MQKNGLRRRRKYAIVLLIFAFLPCFTGCQSLHTPPKERLLLLMERAPSLPAGTLYASADAEWEEAYMPPGMAESLYDLCGYSELSHAEAYAFYLPKREDAFLELAVFEAKDESGVRDLYDMCRYRGEFLKRAGSVTQYEVWIEDRLFVFLRAEK